MSAFFQDGRGRWVGGAPPPQSRRTTGADTTDPANRPTLPLLLESVNRPNGAPGAGAWRHEDGTSGVKPSRGLSSLARPDENAHANAGAMVPYGIAALAAEDDDDYEGEEGAGMDRLVDAVGDAALRLRVGLRCKGMVVSDEAAVQCATRLVLHRRHRGGGENDHAPPPTTITRTP